VLWLKGSPKVPKEKGEIINLFFHRSFIRVRPVTRSIAHDAQHFVWSHGVKPKDAIHVATALDAKVGILETFDGDLIAKTGTLGNPTLLIRKPIPARSPKLFP
jgi:predicted nucleic acid-binding protein